MTSEASSQPIASAWRSASRDRAGPMVTTATTVEASASFRSSAISIAYSSYGEIDQVTPSVLIDLPSAATETRTVESGTCLSGIRIFTTDCRPSGPLALEPPRDELQNVHRADLLLHALCPDALLEHDQTKRGAARDFVGPDVSCDKLVAPVCITDLQPVLCIP